MFIPGLDMKAIRYEHLLRVMDGLIEQKEKLERRFTERGSRKVRVDP